MSTELESLKSALYRKLLAANQDVRECRRKPLRERTEGDLQDLRDTAKVLDTALSAVINQLKLPEAQRDPRVYAICMNHYKQL